MFLSVFDLFKIGIGPSSSHTMGPMTAAAMFLAKIKTYESKHKSDDVVSVKAFLYGSLAFTGKGHATDISIILGLCGEQPATTDPDNNEKILERIYNKKYISTEDGKHYLFDPDKDLIFNYSEELPGHPNGLAFEAIGASGEVLFRQVYYSVGGGFVVTEEELAQTNNNSCASEDLIDKVPYPFSTAEQMLAMSAKSGLTIADMKRANEQIFITKDELDSGLDTIWKTMKGCIERGLRMEGTLSGGLNLKRRANALRNRLAQNDGTAQGPFNASDYLSLFAIAVNEENAAGGRIVTAPTNGAAGVIPAVINYYAKFYAPINVRAIQDFLLTAAAIGGLLKHNASISGAEVGCQGEVGSAASMAAAGLACVLGGTTKQIENAAEIALEHHLGLTCDPVAGLVQVPCIERNAIGAVKAVSATSLALLGNGEHFVSLDACIATMKETGLDMCTKYKETSQGGLAVNAINC